MVKSYWAGVKNLQNQAEQTLRRTPRSCCRHSAAPHAPAADTPPAPHAPAAALRPHPTLLLQTLRPHPTLLLQTLRRTLAGRPVHTSMSPCAPSLHRDACSWWPVAASTLSVSAVSSFCTPP